MTRINRWFLTGFILALPTSVSAQPDASDVRIPLAPIQGGAARVMLPPPGVALGYEESRCIPDAFCEIEAARTVEETAATQEPRCCSDQCVGRNCDQCGRDSATTQQQTSEEQDGAEASASTEQPVYLAVFDDAAHFSTASCSPRRYRTCAFEVPYVIYEGMTVRIKRDGCYEVRVLIDGPHIPAILRLQLKFTVDSQPAVITLPPIRLSVDELSDSHLPNETHTWFVRRTGYSHRLSHLLAHFQTFTVERNGTAQIGQIPQP